MTNLLMIVSFLVFAVTSCSSPLKKKCETTNWFDYGENVAKQGHRPASDTFVKQCEAEGGIDRTNLSQGFQKGIDDYCTTDFAYRVGKVGDILATDMCPSNIEKQMKARHEQGILDYCQESNGVAAGASGKMYNQVCSKELEQAFLPEFNKGRKRYLAGVAMKKEGQIQDIERDIAVLERKRSEKAYEVQALERLRIRDRSDDSKSLNNNMTGNAKLDNEVQSLRWEMQRLERDITEKREEQKKIRDELREARAEALAL